jgi:uncharacterized protein YifE (UPF0438 family)
MKNIPQEHLIFLRRRPFAFLCSKAIFPPEELAVLEESGNWLEALASGEIEPVTAEQRHFLKVDREEAEPVNVTERAWMRLKGRREYEAEQDAAPVNHEPEDYGMVEWDADRCWW